jgi:hypothetical protein
VNVAPLVPVLANFFDDVLNKSVSELNLKVSFAYTLLHGLTLYGLTDVADITQNTFYYH